MRFTPSTIIPSDFTYLDSYDCGGHDIDDIPYNISECGKLMDVCPVENFTHLGKCCVCGTIHRYGEVWVNDPTNLRITVGHICARKYGLFADDADYNNMRGAHIRKIERAKERRRIRREMRDHLTANPGLADALRNTHRISQNLRETFKRWGKLTPNQVALAFKLVRQAEENAIADGPSKDVPVIDGRTTITAEIVGIKWAEGYGYYQADICKMVCKVRDKDGTYTLYGTMPEVLQDQIMALQEENSLGDWEDLATIIRRVKPVVQFDCRIKVSDKDSTFGIISRPTKAGLMS